jgi:hypothetical protein
MATAPVLDGLKSEYMGATIDELREIVIKLRKGQRLTIGEIADLIYVPFKRGKTNNPLYNVQRLIDGLPRHAKYLGDTVSEARHGTAPAALHPLADGRAIAEAGP